PNHRECRRLRRRLQRFMPPKRRDRVGVVRLQRRFRGMKALPSLGGASPDEDSAAQASVRESRQTTGTDCASLTAVSFFDDLPPPPPPPERVPVEPPPWFGAPSGWVGGWVPWHF